MYVYTYIHTHVLHTPSRMPQSSSQIPLAPVSPTLRISFVISIIIVIHVG